MSKLSKLCREKLLEAKRNNPKLSWDEIERVIEGCELEIIKESRQPRTPRKRNELLDAFMLACNLDPEKQTNAAVRAAAVALADIRSVSPLVKPDEFKARAQTYRKKHPDWPLTPSALSKWWGDCQPINQPSQFTTIH